VCDSVIHVPCDQSWLTNDAIDVVHINIFLSLPTAVRKWRKGNNLTSTIAEHLADIECKVSPRTTSQLLFFYYIISSEEIKIRRFGVGVTILDIFILELSRDSPKFHEKIFPHQFLISLARHHIRRTVLHSFMRGKTNSICPLSRFIEAADSDFITTSTDMPGFPPSPADLNHWPSHDSRSVTAKIVEGLGRFCGFGRGRNRLGGSLGLIAASILCAFVFVGVFMIVTTASTATSNLRQNPSSNSALVSHSEKTVTLDDSSVTPVRPTQGKLIAQATLTKIMNEAHAEELAKLDQILLVLSELVKAQQLPNLPALPSSLLNSHTTEPVISSGNPIVFDTRSRCGGEVVANFNFKHNTAESSSSGKDNDLVAFRHAIRKDFDPAVAEVDPNFTKLKWGPGVRMMTHGPDELVSKHLLRDQLWEPQNTMILMAIAIHFKEIEIPLLVLDIGSNMGLFGLMAAGYGHDAILFEPVPQNLDRICENVQLNGYGDRVTVVPAGVSNAHSFIYMHTSEHNRGAPSFDQYSGNVRTPLVPLDDLWPLFGYPNDRYIFAKIDVEGMEISVLEGAKEVLSLPNVVGIMLEHNRQAQPPMSVRQQRLQELCELGRFKVFCCNGCAEVTKEHGRCVPVDITSEEGIEAGGAELMLIKEEYFQIIDRFNCRGSDLYKCLPPVPKRTPTWRA
jgi:FkbM family methyltransferase